MMTDPETDRSHIWHPFTSLIQERKNILVTSAEGVWLYTPDGRKILDAVSSWWVNIHGHGNPEIAEAIARQARELDHIIFAGFTHPPAIELSRKILSLLPGSFRRVFFSDDGSTSVEVALKMAVQFWHNQGLEKNRIIALEGAYHGDTFGSMAVGGRSAFNDPFRKMLFEVDFLPFPEPGKEEECLEKMEALAKEPGIAAFIYEPLIQGTAGMRTYSSETLDRLITIARKQDILLIADEVMTGFGRTGKLFASDHCTGKPDMMCLSKGLTGGVLPLGLTACNNRIEEKFLYPEASKTFFHGHSYTANPISCSAAIASINLLQKDECRNNIRRISEKHKVFEEKIRNNKTIKRISRIGTILALELHSDEKGGYFNRLRDLMYDFFLEREILMRPLGNVIYVIPPYVIYDAELDKIYKAIEELLEIL